MSFTSKLSIHQYKRLSIHKKYSILNVEGIDLLALFTRKQSKVLFSLYHFYVEVVFDRFTNEIRSLTCFTNAHKIEPYLEQINIDDLTILLSK